MDPLRVRRLIKRGILPARQACKGSPGLIAEETLARPQVREGLAGKAPLTAGTNQQVVCFR